MVKAERLIEGLTLFAESEMLPAMSGTELWLASAALVLARQRAGALLQELSSNKLVAALGLVDEDGLFDVDAATDALKQSVRKNGKLKLDLSLLGEYNLGESDIDTLRECIKKCE